MLIKKASFYLLLSAFLLSSCATQNIAYFQDITSQQTALQAVGLEQVKLQVNDKISIVVNSRNSDLASLFNLKRPDGSSGNQGTLGYVIDMDGCIQFPILGRLKIIGMTRSEVAELIQQKLISQNLVLDPVVTIDFQNLKISVLGEVNSPGCYSMDKDNLTILDAIGKAGDLTVYGKRDCVMVMRTENNAQKFYKVNLFSGADVLKSPVYQLQQNDVVYVSPNKKKSRESTVNGNSLVTPAFWISIASFVATMGVLIFK